MPIASSNLQLPQHGDLCSHEQALIKPFADRIVSPQRSSYLTRMQRIKQTSLERDIKKLQDEAQHHVSPVSKKQRKQNARNKKLAATEEEVRSYIDEEVRDSTDDLIKVDDNIRIPYVINQAKQREAMAAMVGEEEDNGSAQ